MIYGYIVDMSLLAQPTGAVNSWDDLNQGVGYLTQNNENYLVDEKFRFDGRAVRSTVLSDIAKGQMAIHIDASKNTVAGDIVGWGTMSDPERDALFSIIEYLEFTTDGVVAAEAHLVSDTVTYLGYIADSLDLATSTTTVDVTCDSTVINAPVINWVKFGINIGGEDVEFKLWLSESGFATDYPHSTITKVIWPCDPDRFLDMATAYGSVMDAVARSAQFSNGDIDPQVVGTDHSGMFPFETRYVHNTVNHIFSFGLMYKGARPTSMEATTYVRNALLDINPDDTIWRALFPDLFIDGAFYLVPMWDNSFVPSPTITAYRSTIDHAAILSKMVEIFPGYDLGDLTNKLGLMNVSAAEMIIGTIGDSGNTTDATLGEVFPTYIAVDATQSVPWNQQSVTARDFNVAVSDAMGVALGASNTNFIPTETIDGRDWLVVITNFLKIYVLKSDSFTI